MRKSKKKRKSPTAHDVLIPVKLKNAKKTLVYQIDSTVLAADWSNLCQQKHGGLAAYCINKSSKSSADLFLRIYLIYKSTVLSLEQYSFIVKLLLYALSSASCIQIIQPHSKSYIAVMSILISDNNKLNYSVISSKCIEVLSTSVDHFYEKQDRYYFSIYTICLAGHAGIRQSNDLSKLHQNISTYKSELMDNTIYDKKKGNEKILVSSNTCTPIRPPQRNTKLMPKRNNTKIINSMKKGVHNQKSTLILPERKNSILNNPQTDKPIYSSIKSVIPSQKGNEEKGIIRLGKGVAYSSLKTKSQLSLMRSTGTLKGKCFPVQPNPVNEDKQIKNKKLEIVRKPILKPDKNWEKLQPRYSSEPVVKHSFDFSYDKFREYSEARENHSKTDQGVFSELHDSSFLKQRGYDTNTTWYKRKMILDQAETYHEKDHIMKHLNFLINTRVNQKDGASKFAHALEIWEHDLNYIQNMKNILK